MKIFILSFFLVLPGGPPLPPVHEPMESLEQCLEEVRTRTEKMAAIDEAFQYSAGCTIRSAKSDPA